MKGVAVLAKITILVFGEGQDLQGETAIVGVVTSSEDGKKGYSFAKMVKTGNRQLWQTQMFYPSVQEAMECWKRQTRLKGHQTSA